MKKTRNSISQYYQIFELAPIQNQSDSFYKPVKLQFCTFVQKSKTSKLPPQQKWPKFNRDGLFYTPAFILPQDINVLSIVQGSLKDDHFKNLKMHQQPSTNFILPSVAMPNQKRQHHCGVCKTNYFSFQDHILSQTHKTNCSNSLYTKHIHNFISQLFPTTVSSNSSSQNISKQLAQTSHQQFYNLSNSQQNKEYFNQSYDQLIFEKQIEQDFRNFEETPPIQRRKFF